MFPNPQRNGYPTDSSVPSKPSFSFSRSTGSSSEPEASFFTDCFFDPKRFLRADLSCSFSFIFSRSRDLRDSRSSSRRDCRSFNFSSIWLERDNSFVRSSSTSFIAQLSSSVFSRRSIRYSTYRFFISSDIFSQRLKARREKVSRARSSRF